MVQQAFDREEGSRILSRVREGMPVYDRTNHKIGTVEELYLGAVSEKANEQGRGAATAPDPNTRPDNIASDIAEALTGNENIPEELRSRLLREGYIRLNATGLFAADRYILPDQIGLVSSEGVTLRVTRDELIKRQ